MSASKKTPVRAALKTKSALQPHVKDGLGALTGDHRGYFDTTIRGAFSDSLDIDAGLKEGREQENRWDYLLGHTPSGALVGVEPHTARQAEVSTVIKKRAAAIDQLRDHLRSGVSVSRWLWVASGDVQFNPFEKAVRQLDQNGITFVGRRVMAKHL